ncbi:hypothetical protein [Curtobacterium sp. L1-20]|uniref:hypothetical protein n=1 Tax=Curtobacterium sp. L1-20 TaxID=3138181 RepID=UPI003B51A97B
MRNHLATALSAHNLDLVTVLPDLTRRVLDVANGAAEAREEALRKGQTVQAVRIGDAEIRAIATLTHRLGIDDEDVLDQLDAFAALAQAVGQVIRTNPELGFILARRLRDLEAHGLADDVEQHAHRSRGTTELENA